VNPLSEHLSLRPGETPIVEQNTFQLKISRLRKALGLDRHFIKSISDRGYRFVEDASAFDGRDDASNNVGNKAGDLVREAGVLWRALRIEHWFKNALVFLPLLTAHRLHDVAALVHASAAFIAFCLCASSVYLMNDVLDLPYDRRHPHKRQRVIASGKMSVRRAVALIPMLLAGAVSVSLTQPPAMLITLGAYMALMLAYCLRLRNVPVVDVATLAAGYGLRVVAGSAATGLAVASPLLLTCILFFFGLALLKRYAELIAMRLIDGEQVRARGYFGRHSSLVGLCGCASSYLAVALLSYETIFDHPPENSPGLIWVAFPLLVYWATHIWLMARRCRITNDPVRFVLGDRTSQLVAITMATLALLPT